MIHRAVSSHMKKRLKHANPQPGLLVVLQRYLYSTICCLGADLVAFLLVLAIKLLLETSFGWTLQTPETSSLLALFALSLFEAGGGGLFGNQ